MLYILKTGRYKMNKNNLIKDSVLTLISSCILYLSLSMFMSSSSALIKIICTLSMVISFTVLNVSSWINHPLFSKIDFILSFIASCIITLFFVIGFSFLNPASILLRVICGLCAVIVLGLLQLHFFLKMKLMR